MVQVLTENELKILQYVFENVNSDDYTLYKGYSGRAMYGRKCFGINVKQYVLPTIFFADLLKYGKEWEDDNLDITGEYNDDINDTADDPVILELAQKLLRDARTDSLGLGTILYFPNYTVPDDFMNDFDDEKYGDLD